MRLTELVTVVGMALSSTTAFADGFEAHDLTKMEAAVAETFDKGAYHWAIPANMSISCCGTEEDQLVSVTLDRHTDEMGQENRSDEAYFKDLDAACSMTGCDIEEIAAGTASARLISIRNMGGGQSGVNIFVVKDGDRLTIQSVAKTRELARDNAVKVLDALKGPIIGR